MDELWVNLVVAVLSVLTGWFGKHVKDKRKNDR